ncbi:hypothetical protein AARAC_003126 [Aspergillus arachidicola]|uniref:Uncharacterized protein n=1 Tax=Aspergillus arachidicola TaxID=656916 RepID=A0A2G7FQH3_9EURO|nr:hypothetical protein AARAC_003126 [Aspergillus arachidicola]
MARSGYSETDSINESFENIMDKLEGGLNLPKCDLESTPPWSLDYNVPAWAILYNRSLPVPKDTIHIYPYYTVESGIMVEFTTELDGVYELALVPLRYPGPRAEYLFEEAADNLWESIQSFLWYGTAYNPAREAPLYQHSCPSPVQRQCTRPPTVILAFKIGEDVFVEWADVWDQCKVIDHYFVAPMDRNGTIAPHHGEDAGQHDGRQCVKLISPPLFTHDSHNELRILISPQLMSEQEEAFLLPQQLHVNVDQGYMLNIDNGSYFDMENYQAVLYVNIEGASLPQDKEYSVIISSLARTNHELESEPLPISINWGSAIQVIWSAVAAIPPSRISQSSKLSGVPFALQVTLVDPSRNNYRISQPSQPWFLLQIIGPLDPPSLKLTSHFDRGVTFS